MSMTSKDKQKDQRLKKTYGISLNEFNDQLRSQNHGCWICGRTDGRLCQDHIHVKGFKMMKPEQKRLFIRGILCFMCNTALKGFEKTVDGKRNRAQLDGTYNYFQTYLLKGEIE